MHNSHSNFELNFHLVFVTKFRRFFPYFLNYNFEKKINNFNDKEFTFDSIGVGSNHIHLLIHVNNTNFNLAKLVSFLKSDSSWQFRNVYRLHWPSWQNGFFVASVGKNSVRRVKKYLSQQS